MNRILFYVLVIIILLFTTATALAVQPQQSTNKILLTPFYVPAMTQNTNYTYIVSTIVPNGISSITSAIITLDAWINPTRTFNAWVNGVRCLTQNYTISTTYASAGRGVITFDCTNAVLPMSQNTITFRITGGNIGASTAWLDLTYMNNPIGEVQLAGTEYTPGDPATIFVQLKNSYGDAVQNGTCYIDIYYPLTNGTHPYTIQDAPMIQANHDDGLYYYDLTAPNQLGVYMLSAKCAYVYNWQWIYPSTENVYKPTASYSAGTWLGDTLALNNPYDTNFLQCDVAGVGVGCKGNFTFNLSTYGTLENVTNLNLYYSASMKGSVANPWDLYLHYWNGTAFIQLANTLTFVHQANAPYGGYEQYLTNTIPLNAIINGTIKIFYNLTGGTGTGTSVWTNWMAIAVLKSSGTIQDVKGNSEMHITNIANASAQLAANAVWNATTRNLTYYPPQQDLTNYSRISNLTASDVWNYAGTISTNILNQIINPLLNPIYAMNATMTSLFNQVEARIGNITINATTLNISLNNSVYNYTSLLNVILNQTTLNVTTNTTILNIAVNNTMTNYSTFLNVSLNETTLNVSLNQTNLDVVLNSTSTTINNNVNVMLNQTTYNYTTELNLTFNSTITTTNVTLNASVDYDLIQQKVWSWQGYISQNILDRFWNRLNGAYSR